MGWRGNSKMPKAKLDQVRKLIAKGKSERKIAHICGLSKTTIHKIATGELYGPPKRKEPGDNGPIDVRCDTCGGRCNVWPCMVCESRGVQCRIRSSGAARAQAAKATYQMGSVRFARQRQK